METFDAEIALVRFKRTWPWTLRDEVRQLMKKSWEIEGDEREIYLAKKGSKLVRINFKFLKARVTYPINISLTFREWLMVRRFKKFLRQKEKIQRIVRVSAALDVLKEVGK